MASLLLLSERFSPDIGGVARSAKRIAIALTQLNLSVEVITWSRYLAPGELASPEILENGKLRVYRLGLYRHWDMTMPQTLNILKQRCDRAGKYDIVWGHYLFPAGFLAVYFARLHQLPVVVSARGNDIDRLMFPPGDFARLQWTLQQAAAVTAVSQDLMQKIEILSGRSAQLHRNVVDVDVFSPKAASAEKAALKQALGIQLDEAVLGFSGELREKKGQQFLLQALVRVQQVRPACLLIIGELRAETQTLLQTFRTQHPNAAARLVVTGHLETPEQVAQHLRLCDIYLQPSLWDGLPNALLEAMACGCFCIASDAGGILDVIESGKQGFIIPGGQLHRLGDAVLEGLAVPAVEQQRVKAAARSHICAHYGLEQERAVLTKVLASLQSAESAL
ncbi:MAG: glycosyltransferase family 4 protein [Leptolyngbya sp. SIO4C1]|nr:glycosyltransferase family 4 protein [Leptolyngbya sp. SIO4C1]